MSHFIDMTGQTINGLTVIQRASETSSGKVKWICECTCGKFFASTGTKLRSGYTRSCGCLRQRVSARRRITHGLSKNPLYRLYCSIKERCYSKTSKSYLDYGGRGIKMAERWRTSFENFLEDVGPKPENHSLDRVNNDGDYSPENCRWATNLEQANNKRSNINLAFNGVTKTLGEWSQITGISRLCLRHRLQRGWSVEEILTTPILNNTTKWEFRAKRLIAEKREPVSN